MEKLGIKHLENNKYKYIIGTRIKAESEEVKQWILSLEKQDGNFDKLGNLPHSRCICFVAYKVYKKLERILKLKGINLSIDKVFDISKTITTLKIKLLISNETMTKTMLLTKKHQAIAELYDENFWNLFNPTFTLSEQISCVVGMCGVVPVVAVSYKFSLF